MRGALVGFALGYALGAKMADKLGAERFDELRRSWKTITESEEFQGAVASARAFVENALSRGGGRIAGQLRELGARNADLGQKLGGLVERGDVRALWDRLSDSGRLHDLGTAGSALLGDAVARVTSARARSRHA